MPMSALLNIAVAEPSAIIRSGNFDDLDAESGN